MGVDRRETTDTDLTGSEEGRQWISVDHTDTRKRQRWMRALIDDHF